MCTFSFRCVLATFAIFCLVEVILIILMLQGYLQELEPLLYLMFDEEQVEAFRTLRDALAETDSFDFNDKKTLASFGLDGEEEKIEGASLAEHLAKIFGTTEEEVKENLQSHLQKNLEQQQQQQQKLSSPSSLTSKNARDDTALSNNPSYIAINKKFTSAVLNLQYEEANTMLRFSSGVDVNYVDNNQGHLLFRLCTNGGKKETPEILKMVELLLSQQDIDPNDDSSSWSPLKAALNARNQGCVVRLLRHKNTVPAVHAAGLTCEIVPHILPEITMIVSADTPTCFHTKHLNTIASDNLAKIQEFAKRKVDVKVGIRIRQSSEGKGKFAFADQVKTRQQQNQHAKKYQSDFAKAKDSSVLIDESKKKKQEQAAKLKKRTQPWKLVLDPSQFDTGFEFMWFYVTGKDWDGGSSYYVKILIGVVVVHTIVVFGASYFYLFTMMENEQAGIMPDVITPPATPQFGAAQPPAAAAPAAAPAAEPVVEQEQQAVPVPPAAVPTEEKKEEEQKKEEKVEEAPVEQEEKEKKNDDEDKKDGEPQAATA